MGSFEDCLWAETLYTKMLQLLREGDPLRIKSDVVTAIFSIYFITVVSGAILVASGTTASW